jgi:N-acetylmuramoyl-L-alanine amidase
MNAPATGLVRTGRVAGYLTLVATALVGCAGGQTGSATSPLEGRTIVVDAGHGGTADYDHFRVGPAGEREEWINLRVALLLEERLAATGANVIMTRSDDIDVDLVDRATMAVEAGADLFLSIHHNATADQDVNFPIVYFHGEASRNQAGVRLAGLLASRVVAALHQPGTPCSVVSDMTIFPGVGTRVLRHSYGVPGAIVEASFFTNPEEEARLLDAEYNAREANALFDAVMEFFAAGDVPPILERLPGQAPEPFPVFQESERMRPEALEWRSDAARALRLIELADPDSVGVARDLCTRSVRSFPDSFAAAACHGVRARAARALGDHAGADAIQRRIAEHYPPAPAPCAERDVRPAPPASTAPPPQD